MLFKSRALNQAIRPTEPQLKFDKKVDVPTLEVAISMPDVLMSDINSNEDLINSMRTQWKFFFFEDLQYFSWDNFISTIRMFCCNPLNGPEVLTQIVKKEVIIHIYIHLTKKAEVST